MERVALARHWTTDVRGARADMVSPVQFRLLSVTTTDGASSIKDSTRGRKKPSTIKRMDVDHWPGTQHTLAQMHFIKN